VKICDVQSGNLKEPKYICVKDFEPINLVLLLIRHFLHFPLLILCYQYYLTADNRCYSEQERRKQLGCYSSAGSCCQCLSQAAPFVSGEQEMGAVLVTISAAVTAYLKLLSVFQASKI